MNSIERSVHLDVIVEVHVNVALCSGMKLILADLLSVSGLTSLSPRFDPLCPPVEFLVRVTACV